MSQILMKKALVAPQMISAKTLSAMESRIVPMIFTQKKTLRMSTWKKTMALLITPPQMARKNIRKSRRKTSNVEFRFLYYSSSCPSFISVRDISPSFLSYYRTMTTSTLPVAFKLSFVYSFSLFLLIPLPRFFFACSPLPFPSFLIIFFSFCNLHFPFSVSLPHLAITFYRLQKKHNLIMKQTAKSKNRRSKRNRNNGPLAIPSVY
mmetsp:Transcript_26668/g.30655  ORF Transcript_26668/g.30655 Transcript_26668/m.30655 type:complete len:206 (+) Transcript_26668:1325-1942(+)